MSVTIKNRANRWIVTFAVAAVLAVTALSATTLSDLLLESSLTPAAQAGDPQGGSGGG